MSPPEPESPSSPSCPSCNCPNLYTEKRFPRKIGLGIVLVAAVLSFWTYHLSLIVAAIIDGLIYKFVPRQWVCYRCKAIHRDLPIPKKAPTYDHHTAELYS